MGVANNNQIKFFPVKNGDMSLITLEDTTTILIDCKLTKESDESDDPQIHDSKKALLDSIKKRNRNYFVDVFVLTHGDKDHCHGFKDNFYQGDPKLYSKADQSKDLIIMDTMWFSPMIAEQYHHDDEQAHQEEAERRLDMHRNNHPEKDNPGNRVLIIGYDSSKKYDDLDHLRRKPGQVVRDFDGKEKETFSIFIHAPFKIDDESGEKDRNSASIVFQARFHTTKTATDYTCLAMFGGDSDYTTWESILERTRRFKNDVSQMALNWDIFLATHHCSWTFFNETSDLKPKPTSLEVLDYARKGAWIIASSKKIVNNDDNPPYAEAKREYVKKLESSSKFLNTAIEPKESAPKPIVFDITSNGAVRAPEAVGGSSGSAGGAGAAGAVITQG
ncbi:hypothetical protein [Pedobacter panaciterrae]